MAHGLILLLMMASRNCKHFVTVTAYLISPTVMANKLAVESLNSLDRSCCALGIHLYREYIDPRAKYPSPDFGGCNPISMLKTDRKLVKRLGENNRRIVVDNYAWPIRLQFIEAHFEPRADQ